jgi:hypothetical protein
MYARARQSMDVALRVLVLMLAVAAFACDRDPSSITQDPVRATTASAPAAPSSAKLEPITLVVIDRTACARLGVNIDDVVAGLKAAKITIVETRASTENDAPATVVEVAGVHDPAALMATRLGETTPIVLGQVARFEVRRR